MFARVLVRVFAGAPLLPTLHPCAKPTLSTCGGTDTASIMNPDVGVADWTQTEQEGVFRLILGDRSRKKKMDQVDK